MGPLPQFYSEVLYLWERQTAFLLFAKCGQPCSIFILILILILILRVLIFLLALLAVAHPALLDIAECSVALEDNIRPTCKLSTLSIVLLHVLGHST